MIESSDYLPEEQVQNRINQIRASLRNLERRDWWLWVTAVTVMCLLTVTVVTVSFPSLMQGGDPLLRYSLSKAVRGLILVVLLFNGYVIYQQVQIKHLRSQFSEQLDEMGRLQARAEEFHKQANVDPLTGLYNRRFALHRLTAEASRSLRYGHALTVVALDLNNFKQINDRFGHPAGDEVLIGFGRRLTAAIRLADIAARMGGDEFLAILPECPGERVEALLARLRAIQVEYRGQVIAVDFSAGWVSYKSGESPEQFLERADQTLYAHKHADKLRTAAPVAQPTV